MTVQDKPSRLAEFRLARFRAAKVRASPSVEPATPSPEVVRGLARAKADQLRRDPESAYFDEPTPEYGDRPEDFQRVPPPDLIATGIAQGAISAVNAIPETAKAGLEAAAIVGENVGGPAGLAAPGFRAAAEATPTIPAIPGMEGGIADQFGGSVGRMALSVAVPAGAGLRGAAALLPGAAMGAAESGVAAYYRSGAEKNPKAFGAFLLAGGVGAVANSVGALRILQRIQTASGNKLGQALADGVIFEGLGAGQTAAANIIQEHATDEELALLDGYDRSGGLGFLTGLVSSLGASALAPRPGRPQERAVTDRARESDSPEIVQPDAAQEAVPPVDLASKAPVDPLADLTPETGRTPGSQREGVVISGEAPVQVAESAPEAAATTPKDASSTEQVGKPAASDSLALLKIADEFGGGRPPVGGKPTETLPSADEGFYPSPESKREVVIRKVADRFNTLRRVEREAPGKGSDFSGAETRMHGRAAYAQRINERIQDRAVALLKRAGMTAQDMADYATARHAEARNKLIAKRTEGENLEGSGMSAERAADVLAKAKPQAKQAMALHDQVRDRALDFAVESGLISAETRKAWNDTFGDTFASLKTIAGDDARVMPGAAKSLQVKGKEAKRAEGRETEATNPFVSMFQNAQDVILRGEKNIAAQEFGKLVKQNPGPWAEFVTPDGPHAPTGDDIFSYKEAGEPIYIRVRDRGTLKAIKNLDPVVAGTLMQTVQQAGRIYSSLATSRNPEFIAGNLIRDLETSVGNVSTEQSAKLAAKVVKGTLSSAKEIGLAIHKPESAKGYAKEYLESGALTDWIEPTTALKRLRSVEAKLAETPLRTKLRAGIDVLNSVSQSVENATRFSYYKALRESGVSAKDAAVKAKELTVNWSKKGEFGPTMNALYIFSSASANGTLRFAQAWKRNPGRAAKVAGAFTAAGVVVGLYNRMYGGVDEEDGRTWWEKQPEPTKRRNMMIQHESGEPTKIPLAPGWGYFVYFGDKLAGAMMGEKPEVGNVIEAAVEQVSPMNEETFAQKVAPWFLDPFVAYAENRNFAGHPTHTERYQSDKRPYFALPGEKTASTTSRTMAEVLNYFSGGNEGRQGSIDLAPRGLDYIGGSLTSGVGRFFQRVATTSKAILAGERPMWRDVPFVSRFRGDKPQKYRGDFFEIKNRIDAEATAQKAGQPFDSKVLGFKSAASRFADIIGKLRAAGKDDEADKAAARFIKMFDAKTRR